MLGIARNALHILSVLVLGAVLLVDPPSKSAAEATVDPPNVLIFMTDDQRASADGLSVMDDLQRLFGAQGTKFTNAVATTPLCCPSRASIFTGKYVHNHGVTTQKNATNMPQEWTIQYQLRQRGYTTAIVGKYLNNWSGPKPHFDYAKSGIFTNYYNSSGEYTTTVQTGMATGLLNTFENNDAKPWLMYVYPFAPHLPAVPEKQYENAPVPAWVDDPARTETDLSDKPAYVRNKGSKVSKTTVMSQRADMIRTLYSVDDMVETIMARLDALGETNTIAFFLSDNGWMWYEHKLTDKQVAYEDSVRIPMYVRWPGQVGAGVVDPKIVANIDIAATVYDATGITPTNYTPDGRSMLGTGARDHILTEFRASNPWKALWHPEWMYAEYDKGFKEYYAPDDPWQLDNGFKTNDPPTNAAELSTTLQRDFNCSGTACP